MNPTTSTIIVVAIVFLIIGAVLGIQLYRRQRTKILRERFGPEYERLVNEVGDQRQAENVLESRLNHVKSLEIHPLSAEQVDHFTEEWKATQAQFVDEPLAALQRANRLIKEVMNAKGYPVDDFEQRAADISVDYPDLVADYRGMHAIAVKGDNEKVSTEEVRRAMIHGRALFENLMRQDAEVADTPQKERM